MIVLYVVRSYVRIAIQSGLSTGTMKLVNWSGVHEMFNVFDRIREIAHVWRFLCSDRFFENQDRVGDIEILLKFMVEAFI